MLCGKDSSELPVGEHSTGVIPAAIAMSDIAATSSGELAALFGHPCAQSFTPARIVTTSGFLAMTSFWKRARICAAVLPAMPTPCQVTRTPFVARPRATSGR